MASPDELPDPDAVRLPYWLAAADRGAVDVAIGMALGAALRTPGDEVSLLAVRDELAVAPVRQELWPDGAADVRCAQGYAQDVLPIRLCDAERDAVLALPGLSGALRAALNDDSREW